MTTSFSQGLKVSSSCAGKPNIAGDRLAAVPKREKSAPSATEMSSRIDSDISQRVCVSAVEMMPSISLLLPQEAAGKARDARIARGDGTAGGRAQALDLVFVAVRHRSPFRPAPSAGRAHARATERGRARAASITSHMMSQISSARALSAKWGWHSFLPTDDQHVGDAAAPYRTGAASWDRRAAAD